MKDKIIKIGSKGRHLVVPEGWNLIKEGFVKKGDLFANLMTFKWTPIDNQDLEENSQANEFDFLIRKSNKD